ncbi:hypothetical protein CTM59_07365 [Prevotella intermedia]|uniref:HNH endonuclease n=1 Tax=Prevotella intermedia TaxID=28131 RepID=A0A2M8TJ63_PREIN|nr:hypothetical protein [Prevotella intermedia]PJI23978.1 hypothetical protein CTM59_07365 [Prevotella intermedia]
MAKKRSIMLSDFKQWVVKNGILTPNSANSYILYLNVSYNNILNINSNDVLYDYMNVIDTFYKENDMLYAVTIINDIINKINNLGTPLPKCLNDQRSALKQLKNFLHSKRNNVKDRKYYSKKNPNNPTSSTIDDIRDSFKPKSLDKIDGFRVLVDRLGEKEFIRLAVEESYFFSEDLVKARYNEIYKNLGKKPLPARKTTKKQKGIPGIGINIDKNSNIYYQINGKEIPVKLDPDGNQQVRKIIKEKTGYTLCEGSSCIFRNYIISHIWGKAYDPIYFTSFWNIVLVPAWVNSLLDKNSTDQDSIEYKLKETFKKICVELYIKNNPDFHNKWKNMEVIMGETNTSEEEFNKKFPKKGSEEPIYEISIIHEKNDGNGTLYGEKQVGRIILRNI